MAFPWPLLALSSSCFQLASPVFLLSNEIGIDTNQREQEQAADLGKTNCSKPFVPTSVLCTCSFIELLALTLSVPVDTMVENYATGTSDLWSRSALLVSDFLDLIFYQASELLLFRHLRLVSSAFLGLTPYFFPSNHCHLYLYKVCLNWWNRPVC